MDIDFLFEICKCILKDHTYSVVVGYWLGHFLYLVIWDSFERDIEIISKKMSAFNKILCFIIILLVVYTLYHGFLDCFALALYVSFFWLWLRGCFMQGTIGRKRLYVKKFIDLYNSMNDESLVIDAIIFRVDSHFGELFGRITGIFFRILPAIIGGFLGVHFDDIRNLDRKALYKIWEMYNNNLEIVSVIVGGLFLGMICVLINYTELKTRRHIIEYQVEARGLKNRMCNTMALREHDYRTN